MAVTPRRGITVFAPAKVNLFLHVTGRRADGYHRIESLFALIDLADTITLEPRTDGAIVRTRELPGVAEADDLTIRAATRLKDAIGTSMGAAIGVLKRIPRGGGFGGGSSDAASVLLALNHLWNAGLSTPKLAALGAELGADIPFFVFGENAFVRGIGEIVMPVSLPRQWLALAMPPISVATGEIFADPALTRTTPSAKIIVFSESYGRNDLEPVTASRYADVAEALASMRRVVADARMTGSGAGVFAACASEKAAKEAITALPAGIAGRVARTLARHPLATLRR